MTADQDIFDSITFHIDSPDGTVNVIFVEESPGKLHNVIVLVGKSGSGTRALVDALARMITFALQSHDLTDVINELSSITSDKARLTTGGVTVRSIPEAIYLAMLRYRNMYPTKGTTTNSDVEYRPAKFANPRLGD